MKLLLIDHLNMAFRAFFGYPSLTTSKGQPVNMTYGFLSMSLGLIRFDPQITHVAVAFESQTPTWRKQNYVDYKAKRSEAAPEFLAQLPLLQRTIELAGWPIYRLDGYEADDVLASLAVSGKDHFEHICIATGDQDLLSVVDDKITMVNTSKGINNITLNTPAAIAAKYNLTPPQLVDRKALVGDSSDGYPGCPGIGPNKADALLATYGSIEQIYQNIDSITPASVRQKLIDGKFSVDLCRQLARLDTDLELGFDPQAGSLTGLKQPKFLAHLQTLEMHNLLKLIDKLP